MANAPTSASGAHVIDLPVRVGQVLEGKFRVERIIGEGAMGLVVEATHLSLDERVALKFLRASARARPDIVTRFAREARAAAKITSDHVARVFDVGGTDDGSPFIVMELLEGRDLEQLVLSHGCLEVGEAVELIIQACEGVAAAHARGIIHRDIKPANLFITDNPAGKQVKLLDFGISKAGIADKEIDVASANTTQIMGSPHYMSPEQVRSTKDVDNRADIWSLGVVLFELLTGQTPFTATEVTGIIAQVLHEPHRQARAVRPDLPIEVERVIDKCLVKDPTQRYQTAAELANALLPFAPKRARAVAEKATAIIQAGGAAPFQMAIDSLPPPAPSGPRPTAIQSGDTVNLGSLSIPRPAPVPSSSSVTGMSVGANSNPSLGAAALLTPSQAAPQRGGATIYIALAAIIIGCAGGIFAFISRAHEPPPVIVVAAPTPTPTPTPAPTPTPTPTAVETAFVEPVPAPTPVRVNPPAVGVAVAPIPRPAALPTPVSQPAKPSATPSIAKPTPTESEIRHER